MRPAVATLDGRAPVEDAGATGGWGDGVSSRDTVEPAPGEVPDAGDQKGLAPCGDIRVVQGWGGVSGVMYPGAKAT